MTQSLTHRFFNGPLLLQRFDPGGSGGGRTGHMARINIGIQHPPTDRFHAVAQLAGYPVDRSLFSAQLAT